MRGGLKSSDSVDSSVSEGSAQGGQIGKGCGAMMDSETKAVAVGLCAGVSFHLANCLAALRSAAA